MKTKKVTKNTNKLLAFSRAVFYSLFLIAYIYPQVLPNQAVAATRPLYSGHLPQSGQREPVEVKYVTVTAYSSTPDQTDSTPFITANGEHVRWGGVAANFLPFYSKARFPEYFGDQLFVVLDRTHPRFGDRIDIWFPTRQEALQFGKRRLKVEIWK